MPLWSSTFFPMLVYDLPESYLCFLSMPNGGSRHSAGRPHHVADPDIRLEGDFNNVSQYLTFISSMGGKVYSQTEWGGPWRDFPPWIRHWVCLYLCIGFHVGLYLCMRWLICLCVAYWTIGNRNRRRASEAQRGRCGRFWLWCRQLIFSVENYLTF